MNIIKKELINTPLGIRASEISLDKLEDIKIPEMSKFGIPVLNKHGYVKISDNEYVNGFINESLKAKKTLLEIGCAYGHVTNKVLNNGAKISACDMEEKHLEILIKNCQKENLENLYVYPGKFPNEINFPKESFSAILASRVFHFLRGTDIEKGLEKINNWLVPNGKFYFVAVSVYKNFLENEILPKYKTNFANNVKWPGEIEDHLKFIEIKDQLPSFLHVFDIPLMERILPKYGFRIDEISYFDYPDEANYSSNKGNIGFIATKSTTS